MGQTLVEKIISENIGKPVRAGETVVVNVDFAGLHDGSGPLLVRLMNERGYQNEEVFCSDKILFANEFGPVPTREIANEHALTRDYAHKHKCHWEEGGTGHVHAHIYEDFLKCGTVCIVGDSHTTVHGAFGCFATGCGSTDMVAVTRFGKTWIKVPETFRINVTGILPKGVYSKDIMLKLASIIKSDQAIYKSLEFRGETISSLSLEARLTLTSMGVDVGAKNAIMETDEKTLDFMRRVGREKDYKKISADAEADYERVIDINASSLEPLVSVPHYVENVELARSCKNQKVNMVFIGSCTNGRVEDLHIAAEILKGKKIAPGLRLLVIPNSRSVYLECMRDGTLLALAEAGAVIEGPNCGPCMGVHQGIPGDGEVVVATQNRNFKGRMGNPSASIYLSSPAVAAATALTGFITDPRDVMK
ncbi:MAG: aconitase/3-isopropylmalate dehydratase large subunit family protein [Treponemataceae bacterium]